MATIEMTVTEYLFEQIRGMVDIDTELLKGDHILKEDGRHWFKIEVEGYKEVMFENFVRQLLKVAKDWSEVKISIMGTPINLN